ncbi:hypothetical protein FHS95_000349 [Sphingomonas naasensis]|uniref:Uncharacterized protein n=1 Tax=Sphingomonas naasensis TaxID=1344951 RepID=A0A4S1WRB1_9SPHN|nr:hypothetical protein [Sphingomonas naasensis]NIJ18680.1 hypothetical protein [Sphingomonas naasensis]TGX45918.1 hypothetical protein E5A74_01725 [Sphingomonas naasensis]
MKRAPILACNTHSGTGLTAMTAVVSVTLVVMPAAAQNGPQVDLYGYVAPRCWVANPVMLQPAADTAISRPRVICNQATPRLSTNVRTLEADGTRIQRVQQSVPAQQSGRAALEIVVSPQI